MKIWIDAQLSPAIASWITSQGIAEAVAVRDLGLRDASVKVIFDSARKANVIVMTKDSDFVQLLDRFGPPPKILWVTCGNTSNDNLKKILSETLPKALQLFQEGDFLVEIGQALFCL